MAEIGKYSASPNIKGKILGVRTIQDRGRVQIPKSARTKLRVKDGDDVYWVEGLDGKIYIAKGVAIE